MQTISRISEKEREYVNEVLDNNFSNKASYKMVKRLEDEFAKKFGAKYAIAFCNGTATLHIALEAAGVGYGDEVIVPPLTMSATTFAVFHANAIPVFADVDPDTFEISADSIEDRITPRTKAIIPVSLYGLSPDMDRIMEIAKKHHLVVIEDDAQCFLGKYKGRMVGTLGDMSSFSFQSSKHMTSGEGGMVLTDSEELALKIRKYSSMGYAGIDTKKGKISKTDIQDPDYDRHVSMGWNYRMSDLNAAVCLGQLERLEILVERRQEIAALYDSVVRNCGWLIPQKVGKEYENSYWTYVVKLDHPGITWREFRDKYLEFGGDGIYAAWKLTYLEPFFKTWNFLGREKFIRAFGDYSYEKGLCPVAEKLQPKLLQFKTNYWDASRVEQQMDALRHTIEYFSKK